MIPLAPLQALLGLNDRPIRFLLGRERDESNVGNGVYGLAAYLRNKFAFGYGDEEVCFGNLQ